MLTRILNYFGVYTTKQYLEQVEEKGRAVEYARYLERAVDGMSDPAKPIVIMGRDVEVRDVALLKGQQVIVGPSAKNIRMYNIITAWKKGGA